MHSAEGKVFLACVVSGQSQEKMYSAIVVRGEDF